MTPPMEFMWLRMLRMLSRNVISSSVFSFTYGRCSGVRMTGC